MAMSSLIARGADGKWNDEDAAAFAELMLRHSRQHGVIFMAPDGRITGWSHGAHFITGYAPQEAIGQPASLLFTAEDRQRGIDVHELETARVVGVAEDERWHLRKDGARFWSTGVTLPLGRAGPASSGGFVKVFRDSTHLRSRMQYLENVLHECSAQQTEQDIFIATAAHELRNPLAPLRMSVELLSRMPDQSGAAADALGVMDRQLGLLERFIEDLVDLTRVKAGKLRIVHRAACLQAVLADAVDACRGLAEKRGVLLQAVQPSVPIEVAVDVERLHQVVVNLLNNAIKFTPAGGAVWLTSTVDHTHFQLQVKDNGEGIARELLPKIFDVFTQAEGADSHRGAGLGMGLAIVKQIVSLHHGTIDVRSEGEGKGAEFVVRIPLLPPSSPEPKPMPEMP
jgi:PAS domain S-box-containing protein